MFPFYKQCETLKTVATKKQAHRNIKTHKEKLKL